MSNWFLRTLVYWLLGFSLLIFWAGSLLLMDQPRSRSTEEMSVVMPAPVQVLLGMGDRYLAANLGVFRALTVGTHDLQAETYVVLGQVQVGVAMLNPRHEDNYYTAAAMLPWNGQYDAGQSVLTMATAAREKDALPPFFLGFNRYYFRKDYAAAGQALLVAAARSEPVNRAALTNIAARWFEQGYEPEQALNMIDGMRRQSGSPQLARVLEARAQRLKGLITLRDAMVRYEKTFGRKVSRLDQLLEGGVLVALPRDPMGWTYVVAPNGEPDVAAPKKP